MNVARNAVLIALAVMPGTVWAQSGGAARALAPLVACRNIADPRAKANCYDAALDKLQGAVSAREVVIVDKQQANEDRKSLFGFSEAHQLPDREPRAPREARTAKPAEQGVETIDSTVVSARQSGYDRWTIRLATGASWQTLEPGITIPPKSGEVVHIRRGVLGNYMLRIGAGRAMRAMRIN